MVAIALVTLFNLVFDLAQSRHVLLRRIGSDGFGRGRRGGLLLSVSVALFRRAKDV